jgi:hypothetical protein
MTKEIYIGGNVASSKNSKRWTGKCLIGSKTTMAYKKNTAKEYALLANTFRTMLKGKTPPYRVEFTFIRDSKRRFDYCNAIQIVADMMVEYGWIEDDSADIFLPVFAPYQYKKNDGGVIIRVLESDGWEEDDFEIGDIPKLKASDLFY